MPVLDVVRHQHQAHAESFTLLLLLLQYAQNDSFRLIVVHQTSATIHGERNEMGIQSVIDDPATVPHRHILAAGTSKRNLPGLRPPTFKNLGHPRNGIEVARTPACLPIAAPNSLYSVP